MSTAAGSGAPERAKTPEEIEAEIEVKRERLAGTIDALSAKLDVKAQAQAKVDEVKADVKNRANPDVVAAAAAVLAMAVTAMLLRSRR
ncbi:MAG TPA: DUF3618 domain-containing protein [Marmoricola sp.]|nr:DUF3618 domain-containing protein [Marmoricola sp.]